MSDALRSVRARWVLCALLAGATAGCSGGGSSGNSLPAADSGSGNNDESGATGSDDSGAVNPEDSATPEAGPEGGDSSACSPSAPVRRLAVGNTWGCALRSDHSVECWGAPVPDQGQTHPPGVMLQGVSASDINGNCGFTAGGMATCWGGPGTGTSPTTAANVVDVSGNSAQGCVLSQCGDVTCWGADGSPPTGAHFSRIATGSNFACGIVLGTGEIQCWGGNDSGQSNPPQGTFVEIGSGAYHACAITPAGDIRCWGAGSTAGPPDAGTDAGTNMNVLNAGQAIPPTGTFRQVSGGYAHTCAVRSDGTVACWGAGTTNTSCGSTSLGCGQSMPPSGTFLEVRPGYTNTCGIQTDGKLACWGSDTGGRSTPPADFQ